VFLKVSIAGDLTSKFEEEYEVQVSPKSHKGGVGHDMRKQFVHWGGTKES